MGWHGKVRVLGKLNEDSKWLNSGVWNSSFWRGSGFRG